jgi:hypothetical protein
MPYPFTPGEAMPSSYVNSALLKGGKNRIINGGFLINQRGYASGTNLASGSYGFDRWKSGYTNTALTFTAAPLNVTVTISASGVLQQIIERANMPAGTYVLSWTGTATGRVYNSGGTPPAYAASPVTVTLNGSANVVVEFTASGGTRTLGSVQLELGTVPTPFEYRLAGEEFALCQRYFQAHAQPRLRGVVGTSGGSFFRMGMTIPPMRAAPTTSSNGGTSLFFDGTAAVTSAVLISTDYAPGINSVEYDLTSTGWTGGRPAILCFVAGGTCVFSLNAEL